MIYQRWISIVSWYCIALSSITIIEILLFFFFSKQVLDCLINCKWRSYGSGLVLENSALYSIRRAGLSSSYKTYFLPLFHAITGCDQFSFFAAKGKKTCWKTCGKYNELTTALKLLSFCPSKDGIANIFYLIERFVVLLYDSTSTFSSVNECRKELFSKKGIPPDGIPPTTDALQLHIYRAIYQASYCWAQSLCKISSLPDPCDGAGKWKINIMKLYGHPFRRIPKCVMNLFVVAANMAKIVKDVVNVFKHLFHALHSVTVEAIVNVDYFSSLFLALQKIV